VHSCCMCKSDLTSVGCLYVINVYDALRHVAGALCCECNSDLNGVSLSAAVDV